MSFCSGWDTSLRNLAMIQEGQVVDLDQNDRVSKPYDKGVSASLWRTAAWLGGVSKGRDDLLRISRVFQEAASRHNKDPQIVEKFSKAMEGVLVLRRTYERDGKDKAAATLNIVHRRAQTELQALIGSSARTPSTPVMIQSPQSMSERIRIKRAEFQEEKLSEAFESDFVLGTSPAQQAFAVAHDGYLASLSPQLISMTSPLKNLSKSCVSDDFVLLEDLSYDEENAVLRGTPPDGKAGFLLKSGRMIRDASFEKGLNMARGIKGAIAQGADVITKQFIEQSHPWKQKRYEVAIGEMERSFQNISNGKSFSRIIVGLNRWRMKNPQYPGLCKLVMGVLEKIVTKKRGPDHRSLYYELVQELRMACEHPEFQLVKNNELLDQTDVSSPVNILLNLCKARYHEVQLFSFCESLVNAVLDSSRLRIEGNEEDEEGIQDRDFDMIDGMPREMGARRIAVQKGMLRGSSNFNFDPNMQSNIPYVLADVDLLAANNTSKTVRLLRMGSPTIEGIRDSAVVTPEFKTFLMGRQREGKRHLYISLQSSIPKPFLFGDETGRNNAIRSLEEEFGDTFTCVILDQNSHFYECPGKEDSESTVAFKQEFIGKMLGDPEKTGFYFPAKWKSDPDFQDELTFIFDKTHCLVFSDEDTPKNTLTAQEKKDFIEIYYAFLSLHLLKKTGADSANISCKDAIDRAAKTNTLLLKLIMIMQGNGQDQESGNILHKTAHAPALMVKKQAIIGGRRRRLISALKVLNQRSVQERIRRAAQNRNFGVNPDAGVHVQRSEDQSVEGLFLK